MLTFYNVQWAKQHDWFLSDNGDGTIHVIDRWSQLHADGTVTHHEEVLHWTKGFKELRDWAGY